MSVHIFAIDINPICNEEIEDCQKTFVLMLFTIFAPQKESIFAVAVK
jgi:hypothetical protein